MSQQLHKKRSKSQYSYSGRRDLPQNRQTRGRQEKLTACKIDDRAGNRQTPNPFQINFQLHDPQYCVCQTCQCGHHKCKLQCLRPPLTNSTTYNNTYNKTSVNTKRQEPSQLTLIQLVHKFINTTTTYQQKFSEKQIDVPKLIIHKVQSKFQGPSMEVTTYREKYPGYSAQSPYVRKKPDQFRGGLRFKGHSTYDLEFINRSIQLNRPMKNQDNLKTSRYWLGTSSYRDSFKQQNPQDFKPLDYRPKNTYQKRPTSAYQYQSSYKREYENPSVFCQVTQECPAKANLMMKMTQNLSNSKIPNS